MERVARVSELVDGEGRCVVVSGRRVAVFRVGDAVHAVDDTCPHRGGPLSEGWIERGLVVCPLHAWCFDLRTGAMLGNSTSKVAIYTVEVRGDEVWVAGPGG
jgi:nitrite reductase (NADH) small subunit